MYTKVKMLDGKEHVINGCPEELFKMLEGYGIMPGNAVLVSRDGNQVEMKDVVTMQQVDK